MRYHEIVESNQEFEDVLLELLDTSTDQGPKKINPIFAHRLIGETKLGGPIHTAYTMKIGRETFMFLFGKRDWNDYSYCFGILDRAKRDIHFNLTGTNVNQFRVLAAAAQVLLQFIKEKRPVSVYFFGESARHNAFYSRVVSYLRTIVPEPYRVIDLAEWDGGVLVTRIPRKSKLSRLDRFRLGLGDDTQYVDDLDRLEQKQMKTKDIPQ